MIVKLLKSDRWIRAPVTTIGERSGATMDHHITSVKRWGGGREGFRRRGFGEPCFYLPADDSVADAKTTSSSASAVSTIAWSGTTSWMTGAGPAAGWLTTTRVELLIGTLSSCIAWFGPNGALRATLPTNLELGPNVKAPLAFCPCEKAIKNGNEQESRSLGHKHSLVFR